MAQGSSSMMYNPMLMMCQNLYQTSYSQMGGVGGFPIYNQYLYHYCFVDPQEVSCFSSTHLLLSYNWISLGSRNILLACFVVLNLIVFTSLSFLHEVLLTYICGSNC